LEIRLVVYVVEVCQVMYISICTLLVCYYTYVCTLLELVRFYYASITLLVCLRTKREHSVIYTELRFVKDLVVFLISLNSSGITLVHA
jgi:hypothetical protein